MTFQQWLCHQMAQTVMFNQLKVTGYFKNNIISSLNYFQLKFMQLWLVITMQERHHCASRFPLINFQVYLLQWNATEFHMKKTLQLEKKLCILNVLIQKVMWVESCTFRIVCTLWDNNWVQWVDVVTSHLKLARNWNLVKDLASIRWCRPITEHMHIHPWLKGFRSSNIHNLEFLWWFGNPQIMENVLRFRCSHRFAPFSIIAFNFYL